MPYTPAQHRLFEAAAHNPAVAKSSGIPQGTASKMASEGIKRKALANAVRKAPSTGGMMGGGAIGGVGG